MVILVTTLICAFLSLSVGIILSRGIVRPLYEGIAAADALAQGVFDQRLNLDRGDEIGQLAKSFDNMSESLQQQDEGRAEHQQRHDRVEQPPRRQAHQHRADHGAGDRRRDQQRREVVLRRQLTPYQESDGTTDTAVVSITVSNMIWFIDDSVGAGDGRLSSPFNTIAAFNANGAQPHYKATEESHATIATPGSTGNGLLLIDSGGQYLGGTTDITRVVPVGETTAAQRRDYTLVLKGMIALSVARFPRGTKSPLLDTLARAPIWAAGIDFGHGTGHGVGYFLNVHEGPHGITPHLAPEPQTAMEPRMITSNEPGIYRPGKWGVRIENLVLNVPTDRSEFGEFLRFETLTLCPIDTRLIERTLMRNDEIGWLNAYHDEVRRRVSPLVSGAAAQWLQERTAPI